MKQRPRYERKLKSWKGIPRDKRENTGINTGLLDCEGKIIISGDYVCLRSNPKYYGPVFWNRYQECWGIHMGYWDKGKDPNDPESYGKFIKIPSDNGMRMDIMKGNKDEQ